MMLAIAWGFGIRLQNRVEFNQGVKDADGNDATDQAGVDTTDFYLRRLRLYIKGSTAWRQKFMLAFRADGLGNARQADSGDRRQATPTVYLASVTQKFDAGHSLTLGLQRPKFLRSEMVSSGKRLTTGAPQMSGKVPAAVATRDLSLTYAYRGAAWHVDGSLIDPSFSDSRNQDWQVAVRLSTGFNPEHTVHKLTESFLGKAGFGHLAAVGVGYLWNAKNADATKDDKVSVIADYICITTR